MRDFPLIGNYWPGTSLIHRMDPRAKLLATLALILIAFTAQSFAALGVLTLFTLGVIMVAELPIRGVLRSIAPLIFFSVLTALLNLFWTQGGEVLVRLGPIAISEAGVRSAAFFGYRMLVLLVEVSLLTLTTRSLDISEAFERVGGPLKRLRVPVHELGMMMGIALRFLPQLAFEARSIYQAQLSRGADLTSGRGAARLRGMGAVIVPLFTGALRHAETLSYAMDARCYHGADGRTRLHPLTFDRIDLACPAVLALLLACLLLANLSPW
ncbi:energy-coupling factor transporter transmembrane protein EcfT [Eggerthellaceae bacterium zg-1084]|uniref:Energy-coupling factor transporter transmembrane protein EcfT n=1 Tax=Berryella wangjianweii TaxID=2734634 RepID=A0A6M8J9F6_9ACTN|nr:energy-coupling factor transporter transmembrane protein EcfT [Berryella wangjianweii]NPD31106.1 energy-coupling factor transporter transmembrane protein EcfT [Berryella wangjianweii]NPD31968.1 energy-coupling factor transporter transmembrane protein EcfT [Eggerthellaceae bacterium zg-997]QKF07442.1 energy-coupling factor transporter transmembrane protein EcfT [Berryella wangjianweii]